MALDKSDNGKRAAKSETNAVDADLKARLSRLDARLDTFEEARIEATPKRSPAADATQMGRMFRYIGDFVSGVIVGCLLGYALDHVAGTSPWGLIVFLLLGFCAGVWNLVRSAERERLKS